MACVVVGYLYTDGLCLCAMSYWWWTVVLCKYYIMWWWTVVVGCFINAEMDWDSYGAAAFLPFLQHRRTITSEARKTCISTHKLLQGPKPFLLKFLRSLRFAWCYDSVFFKSLQCNRMNYVQNWVLTASDVNKFLTPVTRWLDVFSDHVFPDRVALLRFSHTITNWGVLTSFRRSVYVDTAFTWLDRLRFEISCVTQGNLCWLVDTRIDKFVLHSLQHSCESKLYGYWNCHLYSIWANFTRIDKQDDSSRRFRNTADTRCFEIGLFEVHASQTFPFLLPLLDISLVISNPTTRSFFQLFRGTICRIRWSYRARCCKQSSASACLIQIDFCLRALLLFFLRSTVFCFQLCLPSRQYGLHFVFELSKTTVFCFQPCLALGRSGMPFVQEFLPFVSWRRSGRFPLLATNILFCSWPWSNKRNEVRSGWVPRLCTPQVYCFARFPATCSIVLQINSAGFQ